MKRGEGTSAAQPIDKPPLKIKNDSQISKQSTNLDDLDEEDWPSQDSFKVNSDFSDQTISSSRASESERETIVSNSSSTSSRRSIHRALLENAEKAEAKNRVLTQQIAGMNKALTQMQAMCATFSMHWQEPVVLKSATTKLPNDTKIDPMTAPTEDMLVNTISSNNTTMGITNKSPVDHTADGGLVESNPATDTKDELVSPEQFKFGYPKPCLNSCLFDCKS